MSFRDELYNRMQAEIDKWFARAMDTTREDALRADINLWFRRYMNELGKCDRLSFWLFVSAVMNLVLSSIVFALCR